MTLAAELFDQNEWRILWWETLLRIKCNPKFPANPDDLSFLAYAAESAIRRRNHRIRDQLRGVAARCVDDPMMMAESMATEREVIRRFLHECTNPAYAPDAELGAWSADEAQPGASEIERVLALPQQPLRDVAALVLRRFNTRARVIWVRRFSTRTGRRKDPRDPIVWMESHSGMRGLKDEVSFVNYNLEILNLPTVQLDSVGELFVDLSGREEAGKVADIVRHHGFHISGVSIAEVN